VKFITHPVTIEQAEKQLARAFAGTRITFFAPQPYRFFFFAQKEKAERGRFEQGSQREWTNRNPAGGGFRLLNTGVSPANQLQPEWLDIKKFFFGGGIVHLPHALALRDAGTVNGREPFGASGDTYTSWPRFPARGMLRLRRCVREVTKTNIPGFSRRRPNAMNQGLSPKLSDRQSHRRTRSHHRFSGCHGAGPQAGVQRAMDVTLSP